MPLVYKTLIPILAVFLGTAVLIGFYFEETLSDSLLSEEFLDMGDRVDQASRDLSIVSAIASTTDPISVDRFGRFVERVKNSKTARITIWSPKNVILYSDLASVIGEYSPAQTLVEKVVTTKERLSIRKEFDDGIPVQSAVGAFNDMYFPITSGSSVVGVVEVHSVSGAVLTPLTRAIQNAAVLVIVGLCAVTLIIILIFRFFILSPLARAGALARAVSKGDFSVYKFTKQKDELGELMDNLDSMRVRLSSLVGNLESEVEKRTHQVREEQTRLAASLGSLNAGFVIFDHASQIIYQNKALGALLGKKQPISFTELETTLGAPGNLRALYTETIAPKGTARVSEFEMDTKFFRMFLAPVVIPESGTILGSVLLLEDITEEKALQRAKDDFLSIASHELRTPLTAIRANASLVRDIIEKTGDKETLSMVTDIHTASKRLIKLVHDFLDIAALERGVPLTLTDNVSIRKVITEVINELSPIADEKKVALVLEEGVDPLVKADIDRFKQVITNLIGNALRFTTKGTVTIRLSVEDTMAVLRVVDTGAGIDKKYQSLLFRKFQQADAGVMTRAHSEGTGLGLYITKLIMELMGGTVILEQSELGKGSTFCATIPVSHE